MGVHYPKRVYAFWIGLRKEVEVVARMNRNSFEKTYLRTSNVDGTRTNANQTRSLSRTEFLLS